MLGMLAGILLAVSGPSEVTFRYSWAYDDTRQCPLYKERKAPPDVEAMRSRWEGVWRDRSAVVLGRIATATGTVVPQAPLTVYVVACGRNVSDPLTLAAFLPDGTAVSDEEFLYELTHELLHQAADSAENRPVRERLSVKYPDELHEALNHVLLASWEARLYGRDVAHQRYGVRAILIRTWHLAEQEGLLAVP